MWVYYYRIETNYRLFSYTFHFRFKVMGVENSCFHKIFILKLFCKMNSLWDYFLSIFPLFYQFKNKVWLIIYINQRMNIDDITQIMTTLFGGLASQEKILEFSTDSNSEHYSRIFLITVVNSVRVWNHDLTVKSIIMIWNEYS